MTDQPMSNDELASALLDGEIPRPQTVDADLGERMEQLRGASQAVAAPLPIDEVARERAVAAALAEFDLPVETPIETPSRATRLEPPLQARAARRGSSGDRADRRRRVGHSRRRHTDDRRRRHRGDQYRPVARFGGRGRSGKRGRGARGAPPRLTRGLGAFADEDALRTALGPEAFTAKASGAAPLTCEAEARAASTADLGTLTDNVTLTWQGRPARALLFVDPSGARGIVVVADPTCEVLDLLG